MKRKFTMIVAVILLLIFPLNVLGNGTDYPLKIQYPDGVESADMSLFANSRIEKPIDTSFEKSSEIKSLIEESQSNQLSVSEDSYSGKFALKIQKDDDKILPVYETDYFATGNKLTSGTVGGDKTVVKEISGIKIVMRDKNVIVSGKAVASEEVSILVKKGQTHAYINQMTADKNGNYAFSFPLMEYGTYQLGVGGSVSETIYGTFELINPELIEDTEITTEETVHQKNSDETYKTKCNYYTLKLKPMHNSETISFYVKVSKFNEFGIFEEEYALIKSDGDKDGVYSVGTDLSRGKWQTVQLNITDLDDEFQNGTVAGLYMKANAGSQWLIDDITSGYRKINETKFNLNEFATGNVVYSENGLQFEKNKSKEEYNISSKVVSGGIKVSEPLTGIQIDSKIQNFLGDGLRKEESETTLYSASLESDDCILNNTDKQILCERVQIPKVRGEIPVILSVNTMTISAKPETEKRYRLKIKNISENSIEFGITPESGTSKIYYINNTGNTIYTDWYDGNITLSSRIKLNYAIKIEAIEYESIEDTPEKDIIMSPNGSITMDLGNLTTDDRASIEYELSYENGGIIEGSELVLELFEGNSSEPYYMTKSYIKIENLKQIFNSIVPKIRTNTKLKITHESQSGSQYIIRVSKIDVLNLEEKDWNKSLLYVDSEITEQGVSYSSDATYLERQPVKNICSEDEKYAVLYPDVEGVVNIGTTYSTVEDSNSTSNKTSYIVYRILNLNNEPVKTFYTRSVGTNMGGAVPVYLHYGMAEYVVPNGYYYLALPANENVMLISKTCYTEATTDSSAIDYTYVDGLKNGYFISSDSSIIYSNVCDNGSTYKYDLEKRTNQKLFSDKLICASADGSHLALKGNGGPCILNTTTNEREPAAISGSYTECFFNAKNELFAIYNALFYCNSGIFYQLTPSISSGSDIAYDFDSTGEYLLWMVDTTGTLYKNINGIWNEVTQFSSVYGTENVVLSNDISTAYKETSTGVIYAIDLNTQTNSALFRGEIMDMTDDNMLIFKDSGYYYMYNPITAEKRKIFNDSFECEAISYNSDTNMVAAILSNSRVVYHPFSANKPEVKYALSFDGSKTWHAYNGGRWQTVSNSTTPAVDELKLSGMSENAVNTIPSSAYEKLYSNNTDILTVDVALYMYSDSKNRTPLIESITVETVEREDLDGLYGIHIEKYNKKDYRKITSLFPVENFGSNAECYYLLYIGNDWLYTYKDNELVKVEKSADALLSNMSESWITFKQYGMTAKELRRISGDVLSKLFVNEDYANTEFGVIYVVKTKNEDTSEYVVNFRLGSSTDFIAEEDIVVELTMNGGDVKIIDSTQFSSTDIENLLSWVEARQSGSGEIFYRLKNEKTQHFINYYMINSISVYNGEEYRSKNTAE